jgi:hypothetical protein
MTARFRIPTDEFAAQLGQADLLQRRHMLNDFEFNNDFCYPKIDRDRGPAQWYQVTMPSLLPPAKEVRQ